MPGSAPGTSDSPPAGVSTLVQLLTLKDQELLEPPDLGVTLGCGTNNSSRTFLSVSGGCIRFAGKGGSVGQSLGFTTGPTLLQPEVASAQISSDGSTSGFSIFLPLLVGFGHAGLRRREVLFELPDLVLVVGLGLPVSGEVFSHDQLGSRGGALSTLPITDTDAASDGGDNEQGCEDGVHGCFPVRQSRYSASRRLASPCTKRYSGLPFGSFLPVFT